MSQDGSSVQQTTEIIASTTVVGGSIKTAHNVRVSGTVEGHVESAGRVVLESGARIGGGIRALAGDINGEVEGDIYAPEGTVNLRSSAVVHGDISAAQLIVAEGARLQGRCTTTRSIGNQDDTEDDPFLQSRIKAA